MSGEAGKGPGRREGDDGKKYRKNFVNIKGMNSGPDIERDFEEKFMGKTAEEKGEAPSGKYFME